MDISAIGAGGEHLIRFYKQPASVMPFSRWFDEHITAANLDWYRPCVNRVTELLQDVALSESQSLSDGMSELD
jgi:hypothetical protein